MPAWTIFSPNDPATNSRDKNDHNHPMRMNIYWIMKGVYHMLDPSNEPSSTTDEVKHIATLEYTISQENAGPPDISSLVIHLRLSTQTDTRFDVVLRDMRIEDKVENVCVSLPGELTPVLMDISEFVREFVLRRSAIKWKPASDCSFGGRIWQQMQAEASVDCSSIIMMQIECFRNTVDVFHSRRLLVLNNLVDALYASPVLTNAKAVRLHPADRSVAMDLPNPHSHSALSIKTIHYVFRALKSRGPRGSWRNVLGANLGAVPRI